MYSIEISFLKDNFEINRQNFIQANSNETLKNALTLVLDNCTYVAHNAYTTYHNVSFKQITPSGTLTYMIEPDEDNLPVAVLVDQYTAPEQSVVILQPIN